jgi:uncharacterized phage protein gp47/JayE
MAGLTEQGYTIKRLQDIIDSYNQKAKELFQDLVPEGDEVDVTANSALGRIIGVATPAAVDLWEASQDVYSSFDPNSATGIALDNVCQYLRITRLPASASSVTIKCKADYNTTITSGSKVLGSSGKTFTTPTILTMNGVDAFSMDFTINTVANSTDYTITVVNGTVSQTFTYASDPSATESEIVNGLKTVIDSQASSLFSTVISGGTLSVTSKVEFTTYTFTKSSNINFLKSTKYTTVICDEVGVIEQPANTITQISTPILGWDSVTNPLSAITGRNTETDDELRQRFVDAKYVVGTNTLDALYSDLISLQGVKIARVFENNTETTDSMGIPEHAFMAIVDGGDTQEIFNTVWKNKPAGIGTHGNTTGSVLDVQNTNRTVKFERPAYTNVYITVDVTYSSADGWTSDSSLKIKEALVQYFLDNQGLDDDVRISRLYTPINSVQGHYVTSLKIGTSPSPTGVVDLTIAYNRIARTEPSFIVINATGS